MVTQLNRSYKRVAMQNNVTDSTLWFLSLPFTLYCEVSFSSLTLSVSLRTGHWPMKIGRIKKLATLKTNYFI